MPGSYYSPISRVMFDTAHALESHPHHGVVAVFGVKVKSQARTLVLRDVRRIESVMRLKEGLQMLATESERY